MPSWEFRIRPGGNLHQPAWVIPPSFAFPDPALLNSDLAGRRIVAKETIMTDDIRQIDYYYMSVPDKPGEGARILTALHEARVNSVFRPSRTARADRNSTLSRKTAPLSSRLPGPRNSS